MTADVTPKVQTFIEAVVSAMGLSLQATVEAGPDGIRVTLDGDGGDPLLHKRGAALEALQHILNTAFRHELPDTQRIVVDYRDFRKGKDAELRETALILAERVKKTGDPQEIGPLNAYARRIVHLAVAEDPAVSSESIGDALLKTVIISAKQNR